MPLMKLISQLQEIPLTQAVTLSLNVSGSLIMKAMVYPAEAAQLII